MSGPKLYRVRIKSEVFVVANSGSEAEDFALSDRDVMDDVMENADAMASVATAKSVSEEEGNCLPWVDDELDGDVDKNRTVKAWAELNDEAAERARRERELNAKQLTLPGT